MITDFLFNNFWLCISIIGIILVVCILRIWAETKLSHMEYIDEIGKKIPLKYSRRK